MEAGHGPYLSVGYFHIHSWNSQQLGRGRGVEFKVILGDLVEVEVVSGVRKGMQDNRHYDTFLLLSYT